jgi:predicted dehydrogenase
MKKIKLGIVGTGMMLDYHLKAFNKLPNASVKGCTRAFYGDAEKQIIQNKSLEEIATKRGIIPYSNFEEMLNDRDLQAIIIASINPYHFDHIMMALEKGKHVLVEKPVVTDFDHLDAIVAKAREKGLLVFPSHNFVYRPVVIKAKEIIDSGVLGTIIYSSFISCFRSNEVHAHGWRASAELSKGGALMDSGHHQIYQSLFLLGMPKLIHGFKSRQVLKHMEVEDFAMITAYYGDGSIANIGQGHSSNYGDVVSGIKIVGENGNIVISDACYYNGQKVAEDADYANSFYHQAQFFIDSLRNKKKPLSGLTDVRNTLETIYAAYKSAENEQVVRI